MRVEAGKLVGMTTDRLPRAPRLLIAGNAVSALGTGMVTVRARKWRHRPDPHPGWLPG